MGCEKNLSRVIQQITSKENMTTLHPIMCAQDGKNDNNPRDDGSFSGRPWGGGAGVVRRHLGLL